MEFPNQKKATHKTPDWLAHENLCNADQLGCKLSVKCFGVIETADMKASPVRPWLHNLVRTVFGILSDPLLLEQDHGHDHGLCNKAQANGNDVEHVTQDHSTEKQQDQAGPHEQHNVQVWNRVTQACE